jgi:hypothetical protein
MKSVVLQIMEAIEFEYQKMIPDWKFPNKETWLQKEKDQTTLFAYHYTLLPMEEIEDNFNNTFNAEEK